MSGSLTEEQAIALHAWVLDRDVHDFGAGDLQLAIAMLHLGAKSVTAVDKQYIGRNVLKTQAGLIPVGDYFDRYVTTDPRVDVAFLSWPVAYGTQGLVDLVRRAKHVIYLGHNFDGTSCGSNELWQHLMCRDIELAVSNHRNTLIVYGKHDTRIHRRLVPEEYAALVRDRVPHYYQYGSLEGQRLYFP